MTRRLYALLLVAVASGTLIAGCGGSSSPAKTTTTKKSTPAATTTTPATTTTTPPATSGAPSSAELKIAAAACKTAESHDTTLNSTAKNYLIQVCDDLESGNLAAFKSDAEKYCASAVASVPAADKAIAREECKAIGNL